jgi:hypothetical protein
LHKYQIFNLKIVTLLFFITFLYPLSSVSADPERTLKEFERKLPKIEKQFELLIKMMSSEKHRKKIERDIEKSKQGGQFVMKDSYVYKVFEQLKLPFKSTCVELKAPGVNSTNKVGVSALMPGTLIHVLNISCRQKDRRTRSCTKPFTKEQSQRSSSIANTLIELHQMKIQTSKDNLPEIQRWTPGFNPTVPKCSQIKDWPVGQFYQGLFVNEGERNEYFWWGTNQTKIYEGQMSSNLHKFTKKGLLKNVSIEYLTSLQTFNDFLSDNNYEGFGRSIMNDKIENLKEAMTDTAEADLSDLTTESSGTEDNDLSLDDLSLPE